MAETPYFRTIPDLPSLSPVDEPTFNFRPYDIFCLELKLCLYLRTLNKAYFPRFTSRRRGNKMQIFVEVVDGTSIVEVPHLQKAVDNAISQYPGMCPLFSATESSYPSSWIRAILPYLVVPEFLNPFIAEGTLFVSLDSFSDYMSTYNNLLRSLTSQLENLYSAGTVVCTRSFAQKWRLLPLSTLPEAEGSLKSILLLGKDFVSIPEQTDDPLWETPGILSEWSETFAMNRSGGSSRRETEGSVSQLGQFFPTISPRQSTYSGVKSNFPISTVQTYPTLGSLTNYEMGGTPPTPIRPLLFPPSSQELLDLTLSTRSSASMARSVLERADETQQISAETLGTLSDLFGLYMASWQDGRFAPDRTAFLLSRLHNEPLFLPFGNDFLTRHFVTRALSFSHKFRIPTFYGEHLILPAETLNEVEEVVSLLESQALSAEGRVFTLSFSAGNLDEAERQFRRYEKVAQQLWSPVECVLYRIDDPISPYQMSCLVSLDVDLLEAPGLLQFAISKQEVSP